MDFREAVSIKLRMLGLLVSNPGLFIHEVGRLTAKLAPALSELYSNVGGSGALVDEIKEARGKGQGFNVVVIGPPGVGKSSYAMKTLYKMLGDWWATLFHVFVDPMELVGFFEALEEYGLVAPAVIIDDAGLWNRGTAYHRFKSRYEYMTGLVQVNRVHANSIIYTTPSENNLTRRILENCGGYVTISEVREGNPEHAKILAAAGKAYSPTLRLAYIKTSEIGSRRDGSPRKYWILKSVDLFDVMLPDDVYNAYSEFRKMHLKIINELMIRRSKDLVTNPESRLNPPR